MTSRPTALRKWAVRVVGVAMVVLFVVTLFNLRYFVVSGASMSPTLESGQPILVERLQYRFRDPRPREVVVVKLHPEDAFFASVGGGQYVKRVVAGPGDVIWIRRGVVYVNGAPLLEPYVAEPAKRDMAQVTVPPGNYFFLGDNRNHTEDSRSWGPVPQDRIAGRVLFPIPSW